MVNLKLTTKYGAMASGVIASIVVAAGISFVLFRRKQEHPKLMRSMSMAVLHGGQLALKRLLEYHEARADKGALLDQAKCQLIAHLSKDKPDYKKLQSITAKLEMSGKEAEAIEILHNAVTKAQNDRNPHEAYELEMLLVEMLIYKGDFNKALSLKCLDHEEISDARRPLYKAIIYMSRSNKEQSKLYWQEFNSLKDFHCEPYTEKESSVEAQLYKLSTDFGEFEKVVNVLREDIEAQAKMKINKQATMHA